MNEETRQLIRRVLKLVLAWIPIIVGFVHQFLMLSGGTERIYVFLDPPGYLTPLVTLQFTWWILLLPLSGLLTLLLALNRINNARYRVLYPYIYFVFLLVFVEPV